MATRTPDPASPIPLEPPADTSQVTRPVDTVPPATTTTIERPAAKSGYSVPSTGTIRWSGIVDRDGVLTLDGDRASTGTMTGALPGAPVLLQMLSKDFTIVEPPSAVNNWRRITLRSRSVQSSLILQWTVIP